MVRLSALLSAEGSGGELGPEQARQLAKQLEARFDSLTTPDGQEGPTEDAAAWPRAGPAVAAARQSYSAASAPAAACKPVEQAAAAPKKQSLRTRKAPSYQVKAAFADVPPGMPQQPPSKAAAALKNACKAAGKVAPTAAASNANMYPAGQAATVAAAVGGGFVPLPRGKAARRGKPTPSQQGISVMEEFKTPAAALLPPPDVARELPPAAAAAIEAAGGELEAMASTSAAAGYGAAVAVATPQYPERLLGGQSPHLIIPPNKLYVRGTAKSLGVNLDLPAPFFRQCCQGSLPGSVTMVIKVPAAAVHFARTVAGEWLWKGWQQQLMRQGMGTGAARREEGVDGGMGARGSGKPPLVPRPATAAAVTAAGGGRGRVGPSGYGPSGEAAGVSSKMAVAAAAAGAVGNQTALAAGAAAGAAAAGVAGVLKRRRGAAANQAASQAHAPAAKEASSSAANEETSGGNMGGLTSAAGEAGGLAKRRRVAAAARGIIALINGNAASTAAAAAAGGGGGGAGGGGAAGGGGGWDVPDAAAFGPWHVPSVGITYPDAGAIYAALGYAEMPGGAADTGTAVGKELAGEASGKAGVEAAAKGGAKAGGKGGAEPAAKAMAAAGGRAGAQAAVGAGVNIGAAVRAEAMQAGEQVSSKADTIVGGIAGEKRKPMAKFGMASSAAAQAGAVLASAADVRGSNRTCRSLLNLAFPARSSSSSEGGSSISYTSESSSCLSAATSDDIDDHHSINDEGDYNESDCSSAGWAVVPDAADGVEVPIFLTHQVAALRTLGRQGYRGAAAVAAGEGPRGQGSAAAATATAAAAAAATLAVSAPGVAAGVKPTAGAVDCARGGGADSAAAANAFERISSSSRSNTAEAAGFEVLVSTVHNLDGKLRLGQRQLAAAAAVAVTAVEAAATATIATVHAVGMEGACRSTTNPNSTTTSEDSDGDSYGDEYSVTSVSSDVPGGLLVPLVMAASLIEAGVSRSTGAAAAAMMSVEQAGAGEAGAAAEGAAAGLQGRGTGGGGGGAAVTASGGNTAQIMLPQVRQKAEPGADPAVRAWETTKATARAEAAADVGRPFGKAGEMAASWSQPEQEQLEEQVGLLQPPHHHHHQQQQQQTLVDQLMTYEPSMEQIAVVPGCRLLYYATQSKQRRLAGYGRSLKCLKGWRVVLVELVSAGVKHFSIFLIFLDFEWHFLPLILVMHARCS